jgi:transcription elongation factor Elf1
MGGNCPRCKKNYTEYPALSRVDNKTQICSACGQAEAIHNLLNPLDSLSPVDEPVHRDG